MCIVAFGFSTTFCLYMSCPSAGSFLFQFLDELGGSTGGVPYDDWLGLPSSPSGDKSG
jgi:hypothetical protein